MVCQTCCQSFPCLKCGLRQSYDTFLIPYNFPHVPWETARTFDGVEYFSGGPMSRSCDLFAVFSNPTGNPFCSALSYAA